jgi:Ca2+-binding RTX toxin-like protein
MIDEFLSVAPYRKNAVMVDSNVIGNGADNIIDGRGGADFMVGGKGNDIYFVDIEGDAIVENLMRATTSSTPRSTIPSALLAAAFWSL